VKSLVWEEWNLNYPPRIPLSLAMDSYGQVSQHFRLVCVEEGERFGSPAGDKKGRVSVLRSALCSVQGRTIELSEEEVATAVLHWLSPQRDGFYVFSFWVLLLLLVCASFIMFLVISSGRCFEHERQG
jgi:hypothetical protein